MSNYALRRRKDPRPELWLKTVEAAYELGMSTKTLSKLRDVKGGPLIEGVHWLPGLFPNSTHQFEVNGIRPRLSEVGRSRGAATRKLRLISSSNAM